MARFLVIRFSAFGDVAMTIPVVDAFARAYPGHEVVYVSNRNFEALFATMPPNVSFFGVDLKLRLKHASDIPQLAKQIKEQGKIDYVVDLHNVLRSRILRLCFGIFSTTIAHIHKGHLAKRRLTRRHDKVRQPLRSTIARYYDVFAKLGFPFPLTYPGYFANFNPDLELISTLSEAKKTSESWIGIAPFAQYRGKVCDWEKIEAVINYFSNKPNCKLFLFGGGARERAILEQSAANYSTVYSVVGQVSLAGELTLMSQLDTMLSMDSANMHLASLVGTPVVSLWGATHPFGGFMGWQQQSEWAVQTSLECRPCSVYGKKECYRGDYACMSRIETRQVTTQIEKIMETKPKLARDYDIEQAYSDTKAGYSKQIIIADGYEALQPLCDDIDRQFDAQGGIMQQARNTIKAFTYDGVDIVVKSYKIPIGINRFIYGFIRDSKARRSYLYAQRLAKIGIGTPTPLAYIEERRFGFFYNSYYISAHSTCRYQLRELIINNELPYSFEQIYSALAVMVAKMHDNGIYHKDLSMGNILFSVTDDGQVAFDLVDLNRMSFGHIGMKAGCRNFERLMGTDLELTYLVEKYANIRGYNTQQAVTLALKYRRDFYRRKGINFC